MPLVMRVVSSVRVRLSRRFATKSSRFGFAVSSGFVVAVVGLVSTGMNKAGFAEGLFDLFGSGFSGGQSIFGQPQPQYSTNGQAAYVPRHHRHLARSRVDDPVRRVAHRSDEDDSGTSGPVPLGRRSVCVRLCDGYAFPVGDYHGEGDRMAHEATCHAECPGAETALYVVPAGSDSLADAVRVGSGRNYSQLPDAFHYTTVLDGTCSCHPTSGNRIKSLLHDFTLRRGDAVMTASGFKVFHGAAKFPFRRNDFVALNRSRDVKNADRATFQAIERASLTDAAHFAQRKGPAPQPVADRNATKNLEHQASR